MLRLVIESEQNQFQYTVNFRSHARFHMAKFMSLLSMQFDLSSLLYIKTKIHFSETDVDAIDVCLGGQFLVVCERNGNLHLIYVPHKRILLTRV